MGKIRHLDVRLLFAICVTYVSGQEVCLQMFGGSRLIEIKETDQAGTELISLAGSKVLSPTVEVFFFQKGNQKILTNFVEINTTSEKILLKNPWILDFYYLQKKAVITKAFLRVRCSQNKTNFINVYPMILIPNYERRVPFKNSSYEIKVSESAEVGYVVMRMRDELDLNFTGLPLEFAYGNFSIEASTVDEKTDATRYFGMAGAYTGAVYLKYALDFETLDPPYKLHMNAVFKGAGNNVATTRLILSITDVDDALPDFYVDDCDRPCFITYRAWIGRQHLGEVSILPGKIQARSGNPGYHPIRYTFLAGSPAEFGQYLEIDSITGQVFVKKKIGSSQISRFAVTVQAQEDDDSGMSETTSLLVQVSEEQEVRDEWSGSKTWLQIAMGLAVANMVLIVATGALFLRMRRKDRDFINSISVALGSKDKRDLVAVGKVNPGNSNTVSVKPEMEDKNNTYEQPPYRNIGPSDDPEQRRLNPRQRQAPSYNLTTGILRVS